MTRDRFEDLAASYIESIEVEADGTISIVMAHEEDGCVVIGFDPKVASVHVEGVREKASGEALEG